MIIMKLVNANLLDRYKENRRGQNGQVSEDL